MLQFLIICPLVFLGGFVDAIAGGGGLITLPAYMLAGVPVHASIATNKLSATMGTTLTVYRYARDGFIQWKLAPFCVLGATIGSWMGAHIALMLSDDIFRVILLVILPVTGIYVIRKKSLESDKPPYSTKKTILIGGIVSLVIGVYDGFYGPGTGTFLLLLLTGIAHMPIQSANGITKLINLTTNVTSLTVYLINGRVLIFLGLVAGIFGIAGNYMGALYFEKGGSASVKPVMVFVLVIFFAKVASSFVM